MPAVSTRHTKDNHPKEDGFFQPRPGRLTLQGGERFTGIVPTWQKTTASGEVVFTTGMTGYVESLTDPSYAGQILTFTYPLIGNYGVPAPGRWESTRIHARGVVVSSAAAHFSHADASGSLLQWLRRQGTPIIAGVDTRALTKLLREAGTTLGALGRSGRLPKHLYNPDRARLIGDVTCESTKTYNSSAVKTVVVIDCGLKENIIRNLVTWPIRIHRVPYNYDFTNETFDGVFISNGPGNPTQAPATIAIVRKLLRGHRPIFGICLGAQLLALAAGAKTYKLPYGHRGQNQPCQDTQTGHCYLTSQNHGYAIEEGSLPRDWRVLLRNLNDGSVEGIAHQTKPFFAVQFHPEAAPGPTDTNFLFEQFYQLL